MTSSLRRHLHVRVTSNHLSTGRGVRADGLQGRTDKEGSLKELRHRVAIRYAVEGDLRFISHHDSLRLLERAFARAQLPIRFSEGFNPRPRMSIVLPRPVGVASQDELVVIELTEPAQPPEILARLSPQMPIGCRLLSAEGIGDQEDRRPCEAVYELPLDHAKKELVRTKVGEFLSSTHLTIRRRPPNAPEKSVDIRPYVLSMEIQGDALNWTQMITQAGTARIGELLEALGLDPREHLHHVRRLRVTYQP